MASLSNFMTRREADIRVCRKMSYIWTGQVLIIFCTPCYNGNGLIAEIEEEQCAGQSQRPRVKFCKPIDRNIVGLVSALSEYF